MSLKLLLSLVEEGNPLGIQFSFIFKPPLNENIITQLFSFCSIYYLYQSFLLYAHLKVLSGKVIIALHAYPFPENRLIEDSHSKSFGANLLSQTNLFLLQTKITIGQRRKPLNIKRVIIVLFLAPQ